MNNIEFDNVGEWLEAFERDPIKHGIIPVTAVADHLGKSAPGITAAMRAGTLGEIKIGKTKFVSAASLLDRAAEEKRQEKVVKRYLLNMIKNGQRSTFYGPLMAELGMETTIPWHRNRIGAILDSVSKESHRDKKRKVVLSVLVHAKTSGTTRPGPGFWGMVEAEGLFDPETMDRDEFVKKHTDAVFKAYKDYQDEDED